MARLRKIPKAEWPQDQDISYFRCALYLVQEEGADKIKIGIAQHPMRRRVALQCGNSRRLNMEAIYEGTRRDCLDIEKISLRYFESLPNSEWVYAEMDDVTQFIDSFVDDAP